MGVAATLPELSEWTLPLSLYCDVDLLAANTGCPKKSAQV